MSLSIHTIPVGPIDTNCYLVTNDVSREAFVIDPGIECAPVLDALRNLTLTDILLTHAHFDHIGGLDKLIEVFGNARIWVHETEAEWLGNSMQNLSASMTGLCPPIEVSAPPSVLLRGGESHQLLGQKIEVLHTPGHTPGHVVYYLEDSVFVGDLIFRGSVGRTDLPGGNASHLLQSIRESILTLPAATRLLPGHGPATTVGRETLENPFLRDSSPLP